MLLYGLLLLYNLINKINLIIYIVILLLKYYTSVIIIITYCMGLNI